MRPRLISRGNPDHTQHRCASLACFNEAPADQPGKCREITAARHFIVSFNEAPADQPGKSDIASGLPRPREASMRTRLISRGNDSASRYGDRRETASMRPRRFSRGNILINRWS